jgi:peptidoglycan/LPS O-acetylase OafA/YrhL
MARARTDLTSLRLALALTVMLSHGFIFTRGWEPGLLGVTLGGWALVGFFLLSGCLITASWRNDPDLARFAVHRATRIVPGFVVAWLICVLVIAPAYGAAARPAEYLRLLILQAPSLAPFSGDEVNGSMWTVSWECACYAAVPICYRVFRERPIIPVALSGVMLCLAVASPRLYLPRLFLAFLAGAALSHVRLPRVALPRLPDISYGTYLYAWPIQCMLAAGGVRDPWVLFAIGVPLALVAGALSWVVVERPAMSLRPRRRVPAPVPA